MWWLTRPATGRASSARASDGDTQRWRTPLTAEALVNALFNAGLFVMIVTLVMSLGMGFTVAQVLAPLRRVGVFVAALAINVLIVPAVAWGMANLFPLTSEQVVGLVLVCVASAGPAGLKAAQLAKRADMALAVSLVVVLQLVNIVAAPLWAQAVVTGASVSAWAIVKDLLLLVLVPLVVGLVGHARYTEHAELEGRAREESRTSPCTSRSWPAWRSTGTTSSASSAPGSSSQPPP